MGELFKIRQRDELYKTPLCGKHANVQRRYNPPHPAQSKLLHRNVRQAHGKISLCTHRACSCVNNFRFLFSFTYARLLEVFQICIVIILIFSYHKFLSFMWIRPCLIARIQSSLTVIDPWKTRTRVRREISRNNCLKLSILLVPYN